jgi:hypothetical protein
MRYIGISERRNKDMLLFMRFLGIFSISRVDNYKNFVIPTPQQLSPKSRRPCNNYMVYNHQSPPTHQQPTYQQPTHLQTNFTVKTGVSFRNSLRHRNSASASVVSTLKSVCLSRKTTLISVKTTLPLSYRVLEMTLLSAEI